MAQSVSAIDDAIAHLDSILARLTNSEPAAAPAAPVPAVTKPAVICGDPIQSAEEVVDVKPKKREEKPIPDMDILKGRNCLKKFVTVEELQGKLVCVILNLNIAKLARQISEAMIMIGSMATIRKEV